MNTGFDDKAEVAKQWDTDPCGAVTAREGEPESAAWYASVRRSRYEDYAPWMPQVMGFDAWRDRDVLEIGVGVGSDHLSFALGGARMHALDLSVEHLRHTAKHLGYHGLSTTPKLGDAEANPYPDESFDLAYSFGVLHHTPGTEKAMAEVLRVLKPGGTALIGLYHGLSLFFLASTLLYSGLWNLGLLRKGWRRLLSEIEYRSSENDAVPLVKVYTRGGACRLMRGFEDVRLSVHHLESSHLPGFGKYLLKPLGRERLEKWFGWAGWYVVIRARKPAAPSTRPQ